MKPKSVSKTVIYAALVGNLLVALIKFIAAYWTGGSAMLAEGVHSVVDTGNQALLLYGLKRAARPPDRDRPLGYGRELYFWSFIVAVLIFSLGAGVALFEGVTHIFNPRRIEDVHINYVVLALAFVFEGVTWLIAFSSINKAEVASGYVNAFRRSKDPTKFMVLFEDSAALSGIVLAFLGSWASATFGLPVLDGVASILIGLVLAATAAILALETKSLLIGESAQPEVIESIKRLTLADPSIVTINEVITAQLAPDQIIVAVSLEFADDLSTSVIETKVFEVESRIRAAHGDVVALFIKPETPARYKDARRQQHV